jgi:glutathione-independent formaldehyde dehydrogenase
MADNSGVVYMGPGPVDVQDIDYPSLELKSGPGVPTRASDGSVTTE